MVAAATCNTRPLASSQLGSACAACRGVLLPSFPAPLTLLLGVGTEIHSSPPPPHFRISVPCCHCLLQEWRGGHVHPISGWAAAQRQAAQRRDAHGIVPLPKQRGAEPRAQIREAHVPPWLSCGACSGGSPPPPMPLDAVLGSHCPMAWPRPHLTPVPAPLSPALWGSLAASPCPALSPIRTYLLGGGVCLSVPCPAGSSRYMASCGSWGSGSGV